ncbi:MAG: tetratricopeptide repeat protein [Gemmatimonadetes bacterium]|nr:tetratricopeptide repeat protein [Gemmatimonadota bacterium]
MEQPPDRRPNGPDPSTIREELDRLLAGPLATSPQLGRFLQYVVEEELAGRADQLKEYTVAVQGLGRPATFDPASDAAVRVAARQLRFKLAEYYAREVPGRIAIDVPKGGYAPGYTERPIRDHAAPLATADDSSAAAPAVVSPRLPDTPAVARPRFHRVAAGIGLLVVVALGAVTLWRQQRVEEPAVIAVLPFANLTGIPDDDILSDGLSDEITSALARDTATRIIARTSAWKFRTTPVDVRDIGRQLGATHLVEGSVRRAGDRYRVTVQLNGTADGVRVWAEQYDLERQSAFGVYDRIAGSVHQAILQQVGRGTSPLPVRRPPGDPRVAQWLAEGRYFWNQRTDSGYQRALRVLTEAATADPDHALTWATLAGVRATMEMNHVTPPGVSAALALDAARKALALDATLGEAWTVIGMMRGFHEWRWASADSAFRRAIALSPSHATAFSWYSNVLTALNDVDGAIAQIEAAQRLDPLSAPIAYGVAQAHYYGRRWDAGLAAIERAMALNPDNPWARLLKGKLLKGAGRTAEARAIFAALGDSVELALLDTSRRAREIPRLMAKLTEEEKGRSQFWMATNFAQVGAFDTAFAWLERGYQARQADMSSILADPMVDPLKPDPRYRSLVARMGLGDGGEGRANR